jgi:translation initiation factor IF-3
MLNLHYHLFNEQIDIYEDVKLLDENNKVIGVYKPDDAKKKVSQLRKDLVLFNAVSKPIICKALSYRQDIVNKFYKDLVLVKKESIMKASNLLKTIKLNPNATDKELQIKTNQIIELAKRNSQVKITIRSKRIQDEDKVLNKINALRNLLHGKVKIITDVT